MAQESMTHVEEDERKHVSNLSILPYSASVVMEVDADLSDF